MNDSCFYSGNTDRHLLSTEKNEHGILHANRPSLLRENVVPCRLVDTNPANFFPTSGLPTTRPESLVVLPKGGWWELGC